MPTYTSPSGVTVELYSSSGDLYEVFNDSDESGAILDAQVTEKRIGGVDNFSFNIPRSRDVPVARSNRVRFIVDGVEWFNGYVTDVPQRDQDNPVIEIKGKGFITRLTEITINETYVAQTFDFILKDILSSYLSADMDVTYNVDKIQSPIIASISMNFEDIILHEALIQLLGVANYEYTTTRYRFWIDNFQEFNFGPDFTCDSIDGVALGVEQFDRGDCESVTAPMFTGETIPVISGVTWARDITVAYIGTYSFLLTAAGAGGGRAALNDTELINDMHGLIAGYKYRMKHSVYLTTGGSPTSAFEVSVVVRAYYSAVWNTLSIAHTDETVFDEWQQFIKGFTIPMATTGMRIENVLNPSVSAGEYANFDMYSLERAYTDFELATLQGCGILRHLFEGYHYQSPEVYEDTSKIINKVLSFRANVADEHDIEYVATIEDLDSQGRYGIFERKYTYPSYVDNTTIGKIATAIIERRSIPQKVIEVNDLDLKGILEYDSNPLADYRNQNLVNRANCNSDAPPMVDGETIPELTNCTYVKSSDFSFIGDYSYKLTHIASTYVAVSLATENNDINDLHTFIPGMRYRISVEWYVPTAGGFDAGGGARLGFLRFNIYDNGAWIINEVDFPIVYDTWMHTEIEDTLPRTAIGAYAPVAFYDSLGNGGVGYIGYIRYELISKVPLGFGAYLLENRRDEYWKLGADCDTLTGWDVTGIAATTVTVNDERVLTGRRALKCVIANGSLNEFIEFTFQNKVPFPIAVRIFMYFDTLATPLKISFFDEDGNEESISFNSYTELMQGDDGGGADIVEGDDGGGAQDIEVAFTTTATVDQWIRFQRALLALGNVSRVRVTFLSNAPAIVYVDRLDVQATIYKDAELLLEEASYRLSSVGLFADLSFGEEVESLTNEINSKIQDGNVALQIFSKQ